MLQVRCILGFVLLISDYCSAGCAHLWIHILVFEPCSQWSHFLSWRCAWVQPFTSLQFCVYCIRSGVIPCIHLWGSACAFCASAGYTWCLRPSSVLLCISSAAEPNSTAGLSFLTLISIVMHLLRCRTKQYRRTFVSHSVSLWNDLGESMFDGVWFSCF